MHPRKQVRDEIISRLMNVTALSGRVFASRVYTINKAELPCALVYTGNEDSEPLCEDPERSIRRDIQVVVELVSRGGDDEIDEICQAVEYEIAEDTFLGGIAEDCYLRSTEIENNGENERPTVSARLTFLVTVFTLGKYTS